MADGTEEIPGLIDRLKRGDPQALADGFSRHWKQLRRIVAARLNPRLNSRLSPSDVLQEAYIDALKRLPHFLRKPEMSFFSWLCWLVDQRLAEVHRYHLGAQRRDASQETRLPLVVSGSDTSSEPETISGAALAARLIGKLTSPSQAALRKEALILLEEALNRMEPLDRQILSLRHFEELSNKEVAEVLGIQSAAASKRYVRALARLKAVLAQFAGYFDDHP
jgi:RNA polymerase sigma-70 factor (ECF subfamily)